MKKIIKNMSGRQTVLNILFIAFYVQFALSRELNFTLIPIPGYFMRYAIMAGFVGIVIIQLLVIKRTEIFYPNAFVRQSDALLATSRRCSPAAILNGFFCFTYASSLIAYIQSVNEFSFYWAGKVFALVILLWYVQLYTSVFLFRLLLRRKKETTLDMLDEEGDF